MADIVQLGLSLDASKVLTARDKTNRALDSMSKASKRTQASVSRLERGFGRLLKGAVLFLGFRQLIRGFQAMVEATKRGEQSAAKVNSVLEATSFSAGRTARAINRLSQAMADTTLFNDDEIRNTAAVLLTFRNIQGQVFDEALKAIADMSTVLDGDLRSAAIMVGKALNDPIARMGELSEAGITLTEGQKDLIRTMTAAGDIAGAQGVILDELKNEFGGAAAGANVGLFASINSTTKAWNEFLEALGRGPTLGPALEGFFGIISRGLNAITPAPDKLTGIREELKHFQEELERLEGGLPTRRRKEKADEARAMVLFLEREIKAIEDKRKAEEEAAEQAAADARAAGDREAALALEREARLKKAQDDAKAWNDKQKAMARAWEKSWGRAIENTQDSFARFFKGLMTDGVSSFEDFAKRVLDIWMDMAAQIAATKLFQAFLGTDLGKGLTEGGTPDLKDIPTTVPDAQTGQSASVTSVEPAVVINFSVAAMDAESFAGFADANRGTFARVIAEAARDSVAFRRVLKRR